MKNLAHIFLYIIVALTAVNCNHTISGFVRTSEGKGIDSVRMTFTARGESLGYYTETDSSGYYETKVRTGWKFWKGWSGTVTPFKENFEFKSAFNTYSNVPGDRANENYTGAASLPPGIAPQVPFIPTWSTTFTLPPETFQSGFEVEAGFDIDQDGKKEFAVFDSDNSKLTLFEATGNNAFNPVWSYKLSGLTGERASIMVGDLDGDHHQELILFADTPVEKPAILVWESGSKIDNLPRDPTAAFQPTRDQNGMIKPSTESIVADFDNDGKDELLLLYRGGANILLSIVSVEVNTSTGSWVWSTDYVDSTTKGLRAAGVGVGDIDHDGNKEIVVVCEGEKAPIRLYSSKHGSFHLVKDWRGNEFPADYHGSSANIPIEDFNNDGRLEAYPFSNGSKAGVGRDRPVAAGVWVVELDTDLSNAFNKKNWTQIAKLGTTSLRGGVAADGDSDGKPGLYAAGSDVRAIYQIQYIGGKPGHPDGKIEYTGRKGSNIGDASKYVPYIIARDSTTGLLVPTNISSVVDLDGDRLSEYLIVRGINNPQSSRNGAFLSAYAAAGGGAGVASVQESNGPPARPTELNARRIDNNKVELSWKDESEKEMNFIIRKRNIDGSFSDIDSVAMDARHFIHHNPPSDPAIKYFVVASNTFGRSDQSNRVNVPITIEEEFFVTHANGLVVGDLGGAGIGWSDFDFDFPPTQQDVLYKGYLLIFSEPAPSNGTFNLYTGDASNFIPLPGTRPNIQKTTDGSPPEFEHTHVSTGVSNPVVFQTHDANLTIEQSTYQQLNTNQQLNAKWVLCLWTITNNSTPRHIKLAMHLDADAAGARSVLDFGDKDLALNMVYQKNYVGGKTIGIALINGMLGGLQTNTFDNFDRTNLLLNANAGSPHIEINPGPDDLEMTLVSDLGTINNGQSKAVYFVLAVGGHETELRSNIEEAKTFRDNHGL